MIPFAENGGAFASRIVAPAFEGLLGRLDGQAAIIGLIIYEFLPSEASCFGAAPSSVYIRTLGVLEELRGRGVAKELVRRCITATSAHRPLSLSLHVATYNHEAIPFYEHLGFRQWETVRDYYFIDGREYDAYLYVLPAGKRLRLLLYKLNAWARRVKSCFA